MGNEQMELMIKIRAQGQEAAAQLKRIEDRMGGLKKAGSGVGHGFKSAFDGISKGAIYASRGLHMALVPIEKIAKGLTVASVAALAFSGVVVQASGRMETLRLRLDGVTASAEESRRIFEDVKKLGIASPFSDAQMADAAISLRQFAMYSKSNLQTISDTATVAQRDMADVVMAIVGMEAEPLRRLGIQFSSAGGSFVAQYRTKLGEVKTETAKTRDEASQMLMDIFAARFGGAAGAFATSLKGVTSTFAGAMEQGLARLGDGMSRRFAAAVGVLNTKIGALIESGKLDEIGERIGAGLEDGVDRARAAFEVLNVLRESDSTGIMLSQAAAGAAEILGRGFLEYLRAGYGVIEGIFRAAFGVVLQEYRMSDLPGAKGARENFARDALRGMTPQDALRYGIPVRYAGNQETMMTPESRAQLDRDIGQFLESSASSRASWLGQAAADQTGAAFEGGVKRSLGAVVDAGRNIRDLVGEVSQRRMANIKATTGYDLGAMYQSNLDRIRSSKPAPADAEYAETLQRVRAVQYVRDTSGRVHAGPDREAVIPASQREYRKGQRLAGNQVVVNVEHLTVRANSPQELKEKILQLSAQPVAVAGGY